MENGEWGIGREKHKGVERKDEAGDRGAGDGGAGMRTE